MKKIILIKLGGSLITEKDKPNTAKIDRIRNIAAELKKLIDQNRDCSFVLGNGAGSFGHYAATKYKIKDGIKNLEQIFGYCEVQDSVAKLNRIVIEELLQQGIPACSINPSSMITAQNGNVKSIFLDSFIGYLKTGIIPVLYGDIVCDEQKGSHIFSTEDLFNIIIEELLHRSYQVEKVIFLCTVRGVYDKEGKIIPEISKDNWNGVKQNLYAPAGFDVTGGMVHKIEAALHYAEKGIDTYITRNNVSGTTIS